MRTLILALILAISPALVYGAAAEQATVPVGQMATPALEAQLAQLQREYDAIPRRERLAFGDTAASRIRARMQAVRDELQSRQQAAGAARR